MDDTTSTNQNLQVLSSSPIPQVVNNQVSQSNPFLDKLNLNKYDDLLANFEIKNPELALKAKKELESIQNSDQPVNSEPINLVPNIVQPVQNINPIQQVQQVPQIPQLNQNLIQPTADIQQSVVNQVLEPVLPTQVANPMSQLDPTILTQSFQQFPKGSENIQQTSKASPEFGNNTSSEAGNEKKVEKIVEELKSIEKSPEETNEKVQKPPVGTPPTIEEKTPEQQKKEASQLEKIKVYGYQIPQKILELGSKVNDLGKTGDLGSAKTWLYILVGRVIATKSVAKNKDLEE